MVNRASVPSEEARPPAQPFGWAAQAEGRAFPTPHPYLLLVFRRTHNSNGLWQHHLVGAVRVQVDAGEEGCLRGVSLKHRAA